MVFTVRQLHEKFKEMDPSLLYLCECDDTVNREGLGKIMQKFGCPEGFTTQKLRQLHDGIMTRVTDNGAVSEVLAFTNGVKQSCVLAPTLFSLVFSSRLKEVYREDCFWIRAAYWTDVHLLNRRR
nr:unnamed protein product [Spirometra erinaceieuropaei]